MTATDDPACAEVLSRVRAYGYAIAYLREHDEQSRSITDSIAVKVLLRDEVYQLMFAGRMVDLLDDMVRALSAGLGDMPAKILLLNLTRQLGEVGRG